MTKKLRYSDILGFYFYHIGLANEDKDMVDTFFTGAAHHLKRFQESKTNEDRCFHLIRHRAHLRKMMMIVYTKGDFSNAIDESNRDLDRRDTWNPEFCTMPDEKMFNKMLPDWRHTVGKEHCSDHYLHNEELVNERRYS